MRPARPHLLLALVTAAGCASDAAATPPPLCRDQAFTNPATPEVLAALDELPVEVPAPLAPGDRVAFDVFGEPDLRAEDLRVLPDGTIGLPLLGAWPVAGKDLRQVQAEVERALGRWLTRPRATLRAIELASRRFTVMGVVNKPGSYALDVPLRLFDAVALAGGIEQGLYRSSTISLADYASAYVARAGKVLPVSFVRLFVNGDLAHNIWLRPGDVVFIPSSLDAEIFVLGQVVTPRAYSFRTSASLVQVITHAGGLAPGALASEVRLIRGGLATPVTYVVDLARILAGEAADVDLAPGDVVFVPQTALASWNAVVTQILPTLEGLARVKYLASPGF